MEAYQRDENWHQGSTLRIKGERATEGVASPAAPAATPGPQKATGDSRAADTSEDSGRNKKGEDATEQPE